jgi:ubiquinone/menaquinone biosynthesis C-methylase UbiE
MPPRLPDDPDIPPALAAQIAAAQVYDDLFVPAEFQEWTMRVAAAARIAPGERVLDVACGTGVLAREVARRVGPTGSVVGIDRDPGMLAVAARHSTAIDWRQGDAGSLPFGDGTFDAVVCQFGLMFFPDRPRALGEMWRVVAPGGRIAVAVWDTLEHTPAYAAFVALLEEVAGAEAANALRAPFALGDRDELAALIERAGLADAHITTHHGTARFPGLRLMIEADLRGWLPLAGVVLSEDQVQRVLDQTQAALSAWVMPDGCVVFDSPAHIVTVSKP